MNILYPVPAGQNGYSPNVRMLNASAETLDTVISPGFVNSIISAGNPLNPNDMLLVAYENGLEFFYQSINNQGVITLAPANQTVPFPFTNVQFVAVGGSDLNPGNNLNAPKATVGAALSAITAGGLVWVLDAQTIENQSFVFSQEVTIYAPNAIFTMNAPSGSIFTQTDTGGSYIVSLTAQSIEATGGASFLVQNGSLSAFILNAQETIGVATLNGVTIFNTLLLDSSALNLMSTSRTTFDVPYNPGTALNISVGATVNGRLADTYYGTQTFINQIISQQNETQETVGRTLDPSDSNTTVNYMNTVTGTYVMPATGIPVGTKGSFVQLSSGAVQISSDGTSTILSYLNVTPVLTNGLNAKADWEQISQGVYLISGNITA